MAWTQKPTSDFEEFVENFNIVTNAMQMRTLRRWNGRDLREEENLAEHTHLVVACAIDIYDRLVSMDKSFVSRVNFEQMIRRAMLHDSLELLRGDILSITKDRIPMIREFTDDEENTFMADVCGYCDKTTMDIVTLADLMACYKFVEHELRYPSNDFAINVYKDVKDKFEDFYIRFLKEQGIVEDRVEYEILPTRFAKGYKEDAGTDILLDKPARFMPMTSTVFNLCVNVTPKEGEMSFLCSRTSAAAKGLIVAMCPIDPNYTGDVMAIVHNISNNIIEYKPGEAFCQVVTVPFKNIDNETVIKKQGKRSDGRLGSTGN